MVIMVVVLSRGGGLASDEIVWLVGPWTLCGLVDLLAFNPPPDENAPGRIMRGLPTWGTDGFGHDVTRKHAIRAT